MKRAIFCLLTILLLISYILILYAEDQLTQGVYLKKLIDCLGFASTLPPSPTIDDYIKVAQNNGLILPQDFDPNKIISSTEKANLLDQSIRLELNMEEEKRGPFGVYRDKAVIVEITGNVDIKITESENWIPAKVGMELTEGAVIKTNKGSSIVLRVGVGGQVKIKENTELKLKQLSKAAPEKVEQKIILFLSKGSAIIDVRDIPEDTEFETYTPTTVAAVRGTIYLIKVEDVTGKTTILEKEK